MSPHKEPNFFPFDGEQPSHAGPGDPTGISRSSVTSLDILWGFYLHRNWNVVARPTYRSCC